MISHKRIEIIESPDFDVRARPRLSGTDDRRPDFARTGFQASLVRALAIRPQEPFTYAVVTVAVPDDVWLPAAATLKAVIDAVVQARVLTDDRGVLAARMRKYHLTGDVQPTVSVEILPCERGEPTFIRSIARHAERVVGRVVAVPVPYIDRSGVPGEAVLHGRDVTTASSYASHLRDAWALLQASGSVTSDEWTCPSILPARLTVHLPMRLIEDADNALLYVLDLLEVARRKARLDDADERTLDQLLTEVGFVRDRPSGIGVTIQTVERMCQYTDLVYYTDDEGPVDAYDPNTY